MRDRRTGRRQWTFPTDCVDTMGRHLRCWSPATAPTLVVANGDYLERSGNRPGSETTFFVLAARTGRQVGSFTVGGSRVPVQRHGDRRAMPSCTARARRSWRGDLITGVIRWTRPFADAAPFGTGVPGVFVRAVIGEDTMLLVDVQASAGRRTVALDGRSGAVRWERPGASVAIASPMVTVLQPHADEVIAVATRTGAPCSAQLDRPSGRGKVRGALLRAERRTTRGRCGAATSGDVTRPGYAGGDRTIGWPVPRDRQVAVVASGFMNDQRWPSGSIALYSR